MSSPATYKGLELALAPTWLRRPYGAAWHVGLGDAKDNLQARAADAACARMPGLAPDDALPELGDERGIESGPQETTAAYRERLRVAHDASRDAGCARSLLLQLGALGLTNQEIETKLGLLWTLADDGTAVMRRATGPVDLDSPLWSSFIVWLQAPPSGWTPPPASNDPRIEQIRRVIGRWKPAFSTCVGIYLLLSGESWGWAPNHPTPSDPGLWGNAPGVWGGSVEFYSY